ncbi:MAG: NUDIX hydrolase [Bryobacteraceae bacterium]
MKVISSKELLTTKIFSVVEEIAKDSTGFEIQRAIVRHAGSAVVLIVDEKERILLVKQYRLPAQKHLWELPAGRLDPGENALQAAKRELREETGFRAKKWTRLTSFWASPGYVEEKMSIFLATDLTEGEQEQMDDERIETKWFSRKELHSAILDGRISDGKTLIGFFFWLEHRRLSRASRA